MSQSVTRLVTGRTVQGSNPDGDDIFSTSPDRPWRPPSPLHSGYRISFPGVERPGRVVNTHPHLAKLLRKE